MPCSIRRGNEHETNPSIRFQSYLSGSNAAAQSAVVSTECPSTAGNRSRNGLKTVAGIFLPLNRADEWHGHTTLETWPVFLRGRSGVSDGADQSAVPSNKKENDNPWLFLPMRVAVFFLLSAFPEWTGNLPQKGDGGWTA